jgi:hypothetical protein
MFDNVAVLGHGLRRLADRIDLIVRDSRPPIRPLS